MPLAPKATCKQCDRRVARDSLHLIHREAGGNWRRAHTSSPTLICTECVLDLAPRVRRGSLSYQRWNGSGLVWTAWRLLTPARH